MWSARLVAIAVLAVALVSSSTPNASASSQVGWHKRCIPDDSAGAVFHFAVTDPSGSWQWQMGCDTGYAIIGAGLGTYVFTELVSENPPDWVFSGVVCRIISGSGQSTWEIDGASATIHYVASDDVVDCEFTNTGPQTPAVGGVMVPANTLAIVAPWLAVIGLVGCIGTVVVVAKKRR